MPTNTLPRSKEDLSPKERSFFDSMIQQIPEVEAFFRLHNVTFRFRVPADFTKEEFDRVGHCLTILSWDWEELGIRGERRWSYILDPGV